MNARTTIPLLLLATLAIVPTAHAANSWSLPETLDVVRGPASPQVGIDDRGMATVAYSSFDAYDDGGTPYLLTASRLAGAAFAPDLLAGITGTRPRLAVNPAGATAIAWTEEGRLAAVVRPAPAPGATKPPAGRGVAIPAAGYSVSDVRLGIDGQGDATIVWVSPPVPVGQDPPSRVFAVEVSAGGAVGPVQEVAGPGNCRPALDVNLAGDAIVLSRCSLEDPAVHFRPAGGTFGPGESVPQGTAQVSLDGSGNALATRTFDTEPTGGLHGAPFRYATEHSLRPRAGSFGPWTRFPHAGTGVAAVQIELQEDGRAIAAWREGGEVRYSLRLAGAVFGAPVALRPRAAPDGVRLEVASRGAALIHWRESVGGVAEPVARAVGAAAIDADGRPGRVRRLGVPGLLRSSSSFAVNGAGQAVGAWEQDCAAEGATAVMVVTFEDARRVARPPCQDERAPKAIAVRRRARLVGRTVRARLACSEACRMTASGRVLAAGSSRPLATAKTKAERRLAARRGGWVELRLSRRETVRVRRALNAGRKVTLRLAPSVRDAYGNGRRWRLRLALSR